ncbi:methyl-accepting chemotaxis protein [Petroclostridium sp. X23]|uniref:methyl-accepting chemotaxis protein n=1 Tax=Petroclostridium sp. X23 TaxID=3045146 RepID=UPI0024AD4BF4|nr:methyl-accepting chemotaxis protein [Petroclostridium sp. X23]WHH60392.1 methyl-accepting chemotaxis protein [Petroclostridium sp. X23]
MKWFYNLKIAAKLILGFIIVAIIAGVVGIIGVINIQKISILDTDMYERHTATMPELANIARTYQRERVALRDLYIEKDIRKRQDTLNEFKNFDNIISESMMNFEAGMKDSSVRESFDILSKSISDFNQFRDDVINRVQSNQMDEAYNLMAGSRAAQIADAVQKATDDLMKLKTDLAKQSSDTNTAAANTATATMVIAVIIGIVIAVVLGIFISRIISKPINKMVEAADKLAVGDVNVNVEEDAKDEIGSLAESFGRMIENIRGQAMAAERIAAGDLTVEVDIRSENDLLGKKLSEMVEKNNEILTNIASASEQVAAGSKQVSDSSIALSQGATEQASSIEELTASLEEISSQTKLNAENANQANQLAENSKSNAVQGNIQMKEMVNAMEEINESSANISKIIKVIDEIAFQTNILALNAAVEAARAGQHGKGFAVVAEEVRNLAARSANAAKETTDMIEGSIKKAEGGTRIAKETAEALNKIVNGIEQVANLVSDITVASNEQAAGIEQINQGIMQVSEVVQANSATSEESAAASEELSSQAGLLKEMVDKFKLKQNDKSYRELDELSPEVLRMLEGMTEKKKNSSSPMIESFKEAAASKQKIALSDKEFGKY